MYVAYFSIIGSCRTYDSPDDTMADLVVGWGCNGYKCGSPAGGEHAAKYIDLFELMRNLVKTLLFQHLLE